MLYQGPRGPLQEWLASFLPPQAVWAPRAPGVWGWALGAGDRGRQGDWAALSQPACRECARPSPGSGGRLEHKAIFIYDSVSGLASV